jgi:hypothetical protein
LKNSAAIIIIIISDGREILWIQLPKASPVQVAWRTPETVETAAACVPPDLPGHPA